MTFLELSKLARQECGIQGSSQPVTVVGQAGILKRVVDWVADADIYIQRLHADWDFLWATHEPSTTSGSMYLSSPDDLGQWDFESFAVNRGLSDGRPLSKITYNEWRSNQSLKTNQPPSQYTSMPNKVIALEFPADDTYAIYANYWKAPVKLTANTDTPIFPSEYHRAIIARVKMWFFEDSESVELYKLAEKEFKEVLQRLELDQLQEYDQLGLYRPALMSIISV